MKDSSGKAITIGHIYNHYEIANHNEGETIQVKPIIHGDNEWYDYIIREMLNLSSKTAVYYMQTSRILPPINYIGGKTFRMIGDTCRMFLYVKNMGIAGEYFFWDGIVPSDLPLLDAPLHRDEQGKYSFSKQKNKHSKHISLQQNSQEYCGLSTGSIDFKMVLIEKIKKANTLRAGLYEGRYQ